MNNTKLLRLPHPKNCMLAGPREMILLASPSPSTSGGGLVSFCGFTRRQVMRVGAAQVRGGMMTRRPLCLLPRIEPPRASTIKLTRNLLSDIKHHVSYQADARDEIKREAFCGWPRVYGTGHWADVVWRLCGRAAGNQWVLVIFFGQWKWSVLLQETEGKKTKITVTITEPKVKTAKKDIKYKKCT